MTDIMSLRPPVPAAPDAPLPLRAFLRAIRTNTLTIWPASAYREDTLVRDFLGRVNVLLNAPDAIHHVLVGNPGNYRRSRASLRILRPITGQGLLLSEGDAWKLQRRTVAPALAPRVMPMLARHVVAAIDQALIRLVGQAGQPINLLATMQTLALDIAGVRIQEQHHICPGIADQQGLAIRRQCHVVRFPQHGDALQLGPGVHVDHADRGGPGIDDEYGVAGLRRQRRAEQQDAG